MVAIETELVLENFELVQGSLSFSYFIYLVKLGSRSLIVRNVKIDEKMLIFQNSLSEFQGLFDGIELNMDKVATGIVSNIPCNFPGAITTGEIVVKNSIFYGSKDSKTQ